MRGRAISRNLHERKDLFIWTEDDRGLGKIRTGGDPFGSILKKSPAGPRRAIISGILLLVFFTTVGAGSMKSKNEEVEVAGKVYLMGNEPFTQVGLKADDGEVYVLQGEQEKQLRALQGKRLSIKGKPTPEKVRGTKAIEVKSFRVLE